MIHKDLPEVAEMILEDMHELIDDVTVSDEEVSEAQPVTEVLPTTIE